MNVHSVPLGNGCLNNISLLDRDRVDNLMKAHS